MRRTLLSASLVAVGWLHVSPAQAAPGTWSIGVERVFGFAKATLETDFGNVEVSQSTTSVSLLNRSANVGYPAPRVALDYIFDSNVSVGGALGYESVDVDDEDGADGDAVGTWLLAPRVGYFASVSSGFGLWPRGGLTLVSTDNGDDNDDNDPSFTALTLEVPLVFNPGLSGLGLVVMPHIDIGLGGGTEDIDQTLTEFGLQFGLSMFF